MSHNQARKRPSSHYASKRSQISQFNDFKASDSRKMTQSHIQQIYKGQFNKTFEDLNLGLHNPENCLCGSCDCGQHLCKIHCQKPALKNSTTYKNSFNRTSSSLKRQQKIDFTPKAAKNAIVDMSTTYMQKYPAKQAPSATRALKRPDTVKFDGPGTNISSYTEKYPGYAGGNPHIKQKPESARGGMPFKSDTTYNNAYLNRSMSVAKPIKHDDNLKTGTAWFGRSSYQDAYNNPQAAHTLSFKPKGRYDKINNASTQFDTSYKKHYQSPVISICPAKTLLMSRLIDSVFRK